jgi:nitrogen-specific signal transduction histidine kinase/ligand-binding sensor protein
MAEKPTYEELVQRVLYLEQEKLESNMMKETLIRGEKWLTHNNESGMNSEINIPEIELDAIINTEEIQSIMNEFCHLTNMVTAILDLKGKVIEATGWQDICVKFHRITPKTALNCTESDLFLAKNLKPGEYVSYKCKNGLWDVVTPLYIENKHLGNIYTGQFFYDDDHIDEEFFIKQAEACGFDKISYLDALRRIPRYSRETINHLMHFLVKFTTYISKIGFFNIQLEKEIRERKLAEEALHHKTALFEAQLNSSIDGIIVVDTQGKKILQNQRTVELLKIPQHIADNNDDETQVQHVMHMTKNPEQFVEKIVHLYKHPDETSRDEVELTDGTFIDRYSAPVVGKDGQNFGRIWTFRDITERKQAEEKKSRFEAQLQQTQKMESIGTLAGGVAHEINNPINGIMNYAQLILDKTGDDPVNEFASEIIHETKRVAKIVRNLLTFARQEKESHSPAKIKDIVNDTMSLIQAVFRKDQISLVVDVSEDFPKIKCRSQQIQQVIMNLFTNARDALNEKYSEYDENKVIKITSSLFEKEERRWIRTTVEDHGGGIEPDIKERMFDPFYTTKGRTVGTGLGLSISYSIVKDHHGELSVESEPGQYTKFHMDLPLDNGWDLEKTDPD